jgi:hypothetical protein
VLGFEWLVYFSFFLLFSHKTFFNTQRYPNGPLFFYLFCLFNVIVFVVTVGSVSSSGVVNPILDFVQFDQQIAKSLQELILEKFNASGFVDTDFL